jgi:protein required for attachment to host cells
MQISDHYPSFPQKTLLVLTNNELARLYVLEEREITELAVVETPELEPVERLTSNRSVGQPDLDAAKQHRREELYAMLSKDLLARLDSEHIVDIILCAPEANKNELVEALHPDVIKRIKEVVPKNLAAMELNQIVRILFES